MRGAISLAAYTLVLVQAFSIPRAQAQTLWRGQPDNDWAREVPAPAPLDDAPRPGAPEGGYTTPDQVRFEDKLLSGVLDQLCRNVRLNLDKDIPFGETGISSLGGYERRLRQLPDGRQGLLETARIGMRAGRSFSLADDGANLALWVGASVDGASMVMRPLKGKKTCSELDTLLDLTDFKTVFPFSAERLSGMGVGELWQLPLRGSWGVSPSAGYGTVSEGTSIAVSITVGGYGKGGGASLTLYRLAEDKLRFRFRIDEAEVTTDGGTVVARVPALQIAQADGILARFLSKQVARQFTRYVDAYISYFRSEGHGQRIILELILDPRDMGQMESLSQVVRGDLRELIKLLSERNGFLPTDRTVDHNAEQIRDHYAGRTGAQEALTATDAFRSKSDSLSLKIPFLFQHSFDGSLGEDRLAKLDDEEEVRIYQAGKNRSHNYFDLPFLGPFVRDNHNLSSQVLTVVDGSRGATPPAAIFIQQRGFLRNPESAVRAMAGEFAGLTQMIGVERAGGPNGRARVPAPGLIPPAAVPERVGFDERAEDPSYKRGSMMLSLYLAPKAVEDILAAEPERIVRAYLNTLDEMDREVVSAMAASGFGSDAVWREAHRASAEAMNAVDPMYFKRLADVVSGLVADLAEVRSASGNDRRAKAFSKVLGGKGRSGLAHDRLLRIVLQVVDPADVKGDFNIRVDPSIKGKEEIAARYRLNGGIDSDPLVRRAGELRGRFAPPSDLTD